MTLLNSKLSYKDAQIAWKKQLGVKIPEPKSETAKSNDSDAEEEFLGDVGGSHRGSVKKQK